jgi:hypothetical protein
MTNVEKLEKFKTLIGKVTFDELQDLYDVAVAKLEVMDHHTARKSFAYQCLLALEDEMVSAGLK